MGTALLGGLKVLELGEFVSAPYCAKLLADLGADVIKIEAPEGGDPARMRGPFPQGIPHTERSGLFLYMNTNKRGVTLDISAPTGREMLLELVQRVDVVVENLGPRRLAELGLGFETLTAARADIVLTSISPFGQSGPYRDYKASDLVSFHMGGYASVVGGPVEDVDSEPPLKAAEHQAEYVAGVNAAAATMAALLGRERNGQARHVDVSKQESMVPFIFQRIAQISYQDRTPSRDLASNPADGVVAVLPTSDGYVAISPREDHLWARWMDVMGNPEWQDDERFQSRALRTANWQILEPLLMDWTSTRRKEDIFRAAQAARVPSFPVNTMEGIFESPQLKHRGFFQEIDHPQAGTLSYPSLPYKFSTAEWALRRPAPLHGEHNQEIFGELLGRSPAELTRLRQSGVI